MRPLISPSLLAANPMRLAEEVSLVANADELHVDIMDYHFVPNLNGGPEFARGVVDLGVLPVDVHLMIDDPDRWAPAYAQLGASNVTFHAEAATGPLTLARKLRSLGAKAGIAFRPTTSVSSYLPYLSEFDTVLVMTVEPGFGGQTFLEAALAKVSEVRAAANDAGLDLRVQVDGGIDRSTIGLAAKAGADVFVAGSAVYRSADPGLEVAALREIAARAMAESSPH